MSEPNEVVKLKFRKIIDKLNDQPLENLYEEQLHANDVTESNEVVKLKVRKLHTLVVDNVNPASIINFLFQEAVIGANDMRSLLKFRDDPQQQCSELLSLLHTTGHPRAFIELYLAIKEESHLQWLVDRIDKLTDQPLANLYREQLYAKDVTVGQVQYLLPKGQPVCGVASLDDEIFVLRLKEHDQVEVYNVITYRLQRCLTVPNFREFTDMTSCKHYHCLYIINVVAECVHRLDTRGAATRWPVNDVPSGLSVNAAHNVIVTCTVVRKIKEFSSHGDLLRELTLPDDVINPWHTVQSRSGQFIVCHGGTDDPIHRVCLISADGRHIVHSHGRLRGSAIGQYDSPGHLTVDDNEFVFVVDVFNRRVTLLSPTLNHVRQVVSSDKLKWGAGRLHLDVQKRRLYVVDNKWKDGEWTTGRAVVFSV